MQDLNDVLAFTTVVEQNGFSAAPRVLNRPKSSISREVDRLEARLGVRLLERSTRRVRPTEAGSEYYVCCRTALADLETAEREVAVYRADPVGVMRIACPTGITRFALARIIPDFMARYAAIRMQIQITNQSVDLIKEKIDVAFRVRAHLPDETLKMRTLRVNKLTLVASRDFRSQHHL